MRVVFVRDIRRFFTVRLLFLLLGCAVFTWAERSSYGQSYENFVLHMLSEHYYLTFYMVPMFLYILYNHLEDDLDYVLIRVRSFPRFFAVKSAAMSVNVVIFILLQLAVFLLMGIGLSSGSGFPAGNPDTDSGLEVLNLFNNHFDYPWQASVLSVLHMMIGLSVLGVFFMMLHHFFEKRAVAYVTIGLLFLMVYGMKSKIPGLTRIPFLFINNYIIFMYNFTYPYSFWVTYITLGMIAAGTAWVIRKYWNRSPGLRLRWQSPKGIAPYFISRLFTARNVVILATVILLIGLWKLLQVRSMPGSTTADYLLDTFWGHGHGYFRMTDYIVMLLMNLAPIYMLGMFLENEKKDHSMMLSIRLRSKWQWGISVLGTGSLFVTVYTLALTTGIWLMASLSGLPAGGVTMLPGVQSGESELWLYITGMKLMELLFQFLFLLTVLLWTQQVTAAFAGIVIMYALYLLPYNWTSYIPAGMSSLAQHEVFGVAAEMDVPGLDGSLIMMLLGSLTVIFAMYVLMVGYKRRFR